MSNEFTKGQGSKIVIEFTRDLAKDPQGNEESFTVEGQEEVYIGGPLVDKNYGIKKTGRQPPEVYYEEDFEQGELDDVEATEAGLQLGVQE